MNLTDKICITTGGGSGIGLDIAPNFAEAGGKRVEDALIGQSIVVSHGWRMD